MLYLFNKKIEIMKAQRQPITNERLLEILKEEIAKCGEYVYSDRRRTSQEMLRMRGVKF